MNIASAGPLYCIWLRGLRKPVGTLRGEIGKSLAWLSLAAFVLGMITGGILLFMPSSTDLTTAMSRFPARAFYIAGGELAFTFICLLIYAACWKKLGNRPLLHAIFPILASTNLLYHFPPMMAVIGKLASNPKWTTTTVIDRPAFLKLMAHSEVLSLTVHFTLASVAVAALVLFELYARQSQTQEPSLKEPRQEEGKRIVRTAAIVALIVSALQLAVGIWILSAIPGQARNALMGGDLTASLLLVGGMLMTFVFLQHLAGVALGDLRPQVLRRVCLLLVILVLMMTATLRATRIAKASLTASLQTKTAVELA